MSERYNKSLQSDVSKLLSKEGIEDEARWSKRKFVADFEAKYGRQLEQAKGAVARGVTSGNLIAFGSPSSVKIADLAVAAFAGVEADTFKGVRILFIGKAEDSERVKTAVAPSGAEYVFVEAK